MYSDCYSLDVNHASISKYHANMRQIYVEKQLFVGDIQWLKY